MVGIVIYLSTVVILLNTYLITLYYMRVCLNYMQHNLVCERFSPLLSCVSLY